MLQVNNLREYFFNFQRVLQSFDRTPLNFQVKLLHYNIDLNLISVVNRIKIVKKITFNFSWLKTTTHFNYTKWNYKFSRNVFLILFYVQEKLLWIQNFSFIQCFIQNLWVVSLWVQFNQHLTCSFFCVQIPKALKIQSNCQYFMRF